jgi:hypothetical protein
LAVKNIDFRFMKKNIKTFIKELVTIIAGILIALGINNWNENRKDKNYINQISSLIDKELAETNLDIVEKVATQESFIDTLDVYLNDDKISLLDITMKSKGLWLPTIKINSFKSLSNSKIELMEYDKISAFSNIEEQKEILRMKSDRLGDFVYSNMKETGFDKKEFMRLLLQDIIGTEKAIQVGIESVLKEE